MFLNGTLRASYAEYSVVDSARVGGPGSSAAVGNHEA